LGAVGEQPPHWVVDRAGGVEKAAKQWPKTARSAWKEWQTHRPDDAQITRWIMQHPGCNFAIATGKEIDVVDADDQDAIDFVMQNLTRTPWVVRTGKGAHFYYQTNQNLTIKNSADASAKLDTRGFGGYVVAPGSLHANGSRYELEIDPAWPVDSIRDLPCLTADDLATIHAYKGAGQLQTTFGGPAGNLAGFTAAPVPVTEGVQEGGRNNNLARLVGGWIQQGYSVTEVMARAMKTNAGNTPPMPDAEVMAIIASVTRTHVLNHAEEAQSVVVQEAPDAKSLLLKPSELKTNAPTWLIKDVMPADGIGCLFGPSGGGKSFAVIDMMLHVAAGQDWHGRQTRKPGSVLYVCGEGLQGIANRLRAWEKHTGIDLDSLPLRVTRQPVMFMDPASVTALLEAIKGEQESLGDISMLVIDTLNRNFGDGDENTTKDMTRFINALTEIQKTLNTTVLVVHHTGLADGERARGSSALRAALDFEIQQKVLDGDNPGFCLVGKKMKDGSQIPDGHFSLKFIPLGTDEQGDEFGSCVIEPLPEDKIAAAQNAAGLTNKGKVRGIYGPIAREVLAAERRRILSLNPSIEKVTVDKVWATKHVGDAIAATGRDRDKQWNGIKDLKSAGMVFEVNDFVYEITQAIE
jgi:hypothetical protein